MELCPMAMSFSQIIKKFFDMNRKKDLLLVAWAHLKTKVFWGENTIYFVSSSTNHDISH